MTLGWEPIRATGSGDDEIRRAFQSLNRRLSKFAGGVAPIDEIGLENVVEDLTPQLGGDLDVNGKKITSATGSNADVDILPDGTGQVVLSYAKWPLTTLGIDSYIPVVDAADSMSWEYFGTMGGQDFDSVSIAGGSINGTQIGNTVSALGVFTDLRATVSFETDTVQAYALNGNLTLIPDGTGHLVLDFAAWPVTDGTAGQYLQTDGANALTFVTPKSRWTRDFFIEQNARNLDEHVFGSLTILATAQPLDSGNNIPVVPGISKLLIVLNAGSDFDDGSITVTGTSVNRVTGATTALDTDTITVNALTTDSSGTDAQGNTTWGFAGAYITSKWFDGISGVTLSTTDLTLTDVDVYGIAFDQFNDQDGVVIETFDVTAKATNSNAWCYHYLYHVEPTTGDKCDIGLIASVSADSLAANQANKYFRLRRGSLAHVINGSTEGVFLDMHWGPNSLSYWESMTVTMHGTVPLA